VGGRNEKVKINKIQLSDQMVENINIYKDFIYYSGNKQIFKMSTDGMNRTKICDNYVQFLKLSGDNIYFSNDDDKDKLYKISIDGTNEKN